MNLIVNSSAVKQVSTVKIEMLSSEFNTNTTQIGSNEIPVILFTDTGELFMIENINKIIGNLPIVGQIKIPISKDSLIGMTSKKEYKEFSASISQNSTQSPSFYRVLIDEFQVNPNDSQDPLQRNIFLEYVSVGLYKMVISWKTGSQSAIDYEKLEIQIGSNSRLTSFGTGNYGSGISYFEQNFETRNEAGVLTNGILQGNLKIRLFK